MEQISRALVSTHKTADDNRMAHTTLRIWFRRFFQVAGPVLTTIGGLTDLLPGPYGKAAGIVVGTLTSLFVSPPGATQKR